MGCFVVYPPPPPPHTHHHPTTTTTKDSCPPSPDSIPLTGNQHRLRAMAKGCTVGAACDPLAAHGGRGAAEEEGHHARGALQPRGYLRGSTHVDALQNGTSRAPRSQVSSGYSARKRRHSASPTAGLRTVGCFVLCASSGGSLAHSARADLSWDVGAWKLPCALARGNSQVARGRSSVSARNKRQWLFATRASYKLMATCAGCGCAAGIGPAVVLGAPRWCLPGERTQAGGTPAAGQPE